MKPASPQVPPRPEPTERSGGHVCIVGNRCGLVRAGIAIAALTTFLSLGAGSGSSGVQGAHGFPPPVPIAGWAPGGSPVDPASQRRADIIALQSDRIGECGRSSLLLYSVRGSGASPAPNDGMSAWTTAAGTSAIAFGWRVRALASAYPAPRSPLNHTLAAAAGKPFPSSVRAVTGVVERYRALAVRSAPLAARELVAAYDRCPQRAILLAGYSEGATVLRYVVPELPRRVLKAIAGIDLIADPTADRRADSRITHMTRRTTGIDTAVTRIDHTRQFSQPRYPPPTTLTRQWCGRNDLVCDAIFGRSLVAHDRYPWATIGANASISLPSLLPDVLVGLRSSLVPVGSPPPAPDDGCGLASSFILAGGVRVTTTENVPSVGGWVVREVNSLSAIWHADALTSVRVSLQAQTPGSKRWPALAASEMTLLFAALPLSRPTCTPLVPENSPLGPAYPAMVYEEIYGTGRAPHFWGCGYIAITGSYPYTVRVLVTAARDPATVGSFTCAEGRAVPGVP